MIEIVINEEKTDLIAALPVLINAGLEKDRFTLEAIMRRDRIRPIWWDGEFVGTWRIK